MKIEQVGVARDDAMGAAVHSELGKLVVFRIAAGGSRWARSSIAAKFCLACVAETVGMEISRCQTVHFVQNVQFWR
jgi:hypothetical protein